MRSYGQISVALGVAIKETGRTKPTAVTVFTDSKAGMKIQNEHLVDQRAKELRDYGPSLIIRWVLVMQRSKEMKELTLRQKM